MCATKNKGSRLLVYLFLLFGLVAASLQGQVEGVVTGRVTDPVGNSVPAAKVTVFEDGNEVAHGISDGDGIFRVAISQSGRYRMRVEAQGFTAQTLSSLFIEAGKTTQQPVSLVIGSLTQQVVVSATGTATPTAQVGASIAVIDDREIQALNKLDVLENLRLVSGTQIVQTGQRGGIGSLFIGGGESDFNKILVDGIPVNEVGGTFDFSQLSNTGVGNLEVLRGANSVLYGSDALSGVVNVTSREGATTIPELDYAIDGGGFGTLHQDVSLGGVVHSFDYFSEFSRFDTQGSLPNSYFHNATVSTNLGWQLNSKTGIRATIRHTAIGFGSPNALEFFGTPDNALEKTRNTYVGVTGQNQTTDRWHNSVQFAFAQFRSVYGNPSATGTPFDPFGFGPNYLGKTVTIRGANGYSVTGQAILDFGGSYPMVFPDYEARRSIYAQSNYRFWKDWTGIFGFRYEHENGDGFTRNNYSTSLEGQGSLAHRFFSTFGVGLEKNSFFGFAAAPRVSLAYYVRQPTPVGLWGETKLKFNFGEGIKEASFEQQGSALISLLTPSQVAQSSVQAIGPERSRTFDFGVDQRLWHGRSILGVTLFYNNFYDLIAFLNPAALITIGVPPAVANNTQIGGAYVNATSERAKGAEIEYKVDLGHGLLFQGGYTYLDGVVTKAFGAPSFNPQFPTIPIGAFSPLEGARPFRRSPQSGSLALFYRHKKFGGAFTGYLVGRRDDSTFLSDGFFGNSMLLPNRNLAPAYQKFDLSGNYAVKPYLAVYTSIENLFSQHYEATFGFPALPFAIRSGVKFTFGGATGLWN